MTARLGYVAFDERFDRIMHHGASPLGHAAQMARKTGVDRTVDREHGIADVGRLVADTLHIADHLKGGRDMAQVACDGLLGEQQLQAQALDIALLTVDIVVAFDHPCGKLRVALLDHLDRGNHGLFHR